MSIFFQTAHAANAEAPTDADAQSLSEVSSLVVQQDEVIDYPAEFFDRYRPTTALDMVKEVPAFEIDDGDSVRGFGGAAGNVLIDERRPSAKADDASDILNRIPASFVERIELIRGQVDGIDLQGRTVVANVVLHENTPPAVRWDFSLRYNFDFGWTPEPSFSVTDRWADIEYDVGLSARDYRTGDLGPTKVFDADGNLTEVQRDKIDGDGWAASGHLNLSTWVGDTLLEFNSNLSSGTEGSDLLTSHRIRIPEAVGDEGHVEFFDDDPSSTRMEVGANAERLLQPTLLGKAIVLVSRREQDDVSLHRIVDADGEQQLSRQANTKRETTERIGRLEFDWVGWTDHAIQLNVEVAYNALDNALVQIVDVGDGPEVVQVPGSDGRVEEVRGDFLVKDIWSLGDFALHYGLGAEVSTISQTVDAESERSFTFLKPESLLTYSPNQQQQTRLRIAREVSQLNFGDFVSAAAFQDDDDHLLGNPELQPETTWIAEIGHERRFADHSVATLTFFHHWISDVEDLLPVSSTFEVPGNIGDGRRWGVKLEGSVPLDWLRLAGARLDVRARWQDSEVEDPVTGEERALSGSGGDTGSIPFRDEDNRYALSFEFRQDFEEARMAWGFGTVTRGERTLYKVNELDIYDEGTQLNMFVEATRWPRLRVRLEGENLLDFDRSRHRVVFVGERALSSVDLREERHRTRSRRIYLKLSGNF